MWDRVTSKLDNISKPKSHWQGSQRVHFQPSPPSAVLIAVRPDSLVINCHICLSVLHCQGFLGEMSRRIITLLLISHLFQALHSCPQLPSLWSFWLYHVHPFPNSGTGIASFFGGVNPNDEETVRTRTGIIHRSFLKHCLLQWLRPLRSRQLTSKRKAKDSSRWKQRSRPQQLDLCRPRTKGSKHPAQILNQWCQYHANAMPILQALDLNRF